MPKHDDKTSLRHMLDHAREAVTMAQGRRRIDLESDRQFGLAMTRLLEIIGEAAARVSQQTRGNLSSIPWPQIVGLRNRLIHGYDEVDWNILWAIVTDDLPRLIAHVESFLGANE